MEGSQAEVDGVVVYLVEAGGWAWVKYLGLSVLAWVIGVVSFDPNPGVPEKLYRLTFMDAESGEALCDDGVLRGPEALDASEQAVADLKRIGRGDFLYKKAHGWRID